MGVVKNYRSDLPGGSQDTQSSLVSRQVKSVPVELREMPVMAYVRHSGLHPDLT